VRKFAFFDFCETLVNFQTADAFVDYIRSVKNSFYMRFLEIVLNVLKKIRIIAALNKLLPRSTIGKRIKLLQLRGLEYDELNKLAESYYRKLIRPGFIKPVITEMQKLKEQGYEICLVSAGYSTYLKYFAAEFQINHLIATEIKFNNSGKICKGSISGKDCIGIEKVHRLNSYFEVQDVNYHESISFSDSITDLPMLILTGKSIVVSRVRSQSWSQKNKFEEIIWNQQ